MTPFVAAVAIAALTHDPQGWGWACGPLLILSGVFAFIWPDEIMEFNRQARQGSMWQMGPAGHLVTAIFFSFFCVFGGFVLLFSWFNARG